MVAPDTLFRYHVESALKFCESALDTLQNHASKGTREDLHIEEDLNVTIERLKCILNALLERTIE